MVTLYDEEGNQHERLPVDAKECIEILGWSTEPKEVKNGLAKPSKKDEEANTEAE